MKNANNLKIIALSLCMLASAPAWAGLGSLQVSSALGEPFSGSVVVTGDEARAALKGRPAVAGAPLQVRVTAQGQNAVIHLRSSKPVHDPMLTFSLTAGSQGRQYTALLDPPERNRSAGKNRATGKQHRPVHPAPARSVKEKSAARATVALQNGLASENAVVKYNVDNNETLMDVARKVRPQGLSLEQTMHAIQVANPNAFRNGNPDLMYRNISLNIPSTSQLKKLSKVPLKTAVKPEVTQNTTPAVTKENPKVAANTGDTAASEVQTKESTVKAETSAASSVPAQASATIQASEVAQASAPAASATSAVVKAEPVQPKVNDTQPAEEPEKESFLPSWWLYALAGFAGVLLIAALLWQRSKKQNSADDEDYSSDDDEDEDDVVFNSEPPEVRQTVPVQTKTAAAPVAATTATEAAEEDDDWSWLNDAGVSDTPAKADDKPAADVKTESVALLSDNKATETKQEETDTDWLNFNFTEEEHTNAAAPAAAEQNGEDDLSWLDQLDDTEQPEVLASQEPVAAAAQEKVADNADLEWVVADEQQSAETRQDTIQVAPQSEPVAASEDDTLNNLSDLQWDDDFKFDDETKHETSAAEHEISSIEQTLAPHDQHAFAAEDDAISTDIDWDSLGISDDDSVVQPVVSPVAADEDATDISALDFALEENKSEPAPAVNATSAPTGPISSFATGDGGQDWLEQSAEPEQVDKPLTPEQQAIPLQAKLELAKMYLEMDDAVTARQTLRELVDEANGTILAEAQNLLQQLGG